MHFKGSGMNPRYYAAITITKYGEPPQTLSLTGGEVSRLMVRATNAARNLYDACPRDEWGQDRIRGIRIDFGDCEA